MFRNPEDDRLMRAIAQRQPVLRLAAEEAALPVVAERKKVQRGGYVYKPLCNHPLDYGTEKFEADQVMRRLRLLPMARRIEAATAMNLPWCIESLYIAGAPCDAPNKSGYTPLHVAAARNFPMCVEVLLNMKMDIKVNALTLKGYTALYLAVACKSDLCAKMIRDAGGKEVVEVPIKGYRSILDLPVEMPHAVPFVNRAADDRARNLGVPTYFGQY